MPMEVEDAHMAAAQDGAARLSASECAVRAGEELLDGAPSDDEFIGIDGDGTAHFITLNEVVLDVGAGAVRKRCRGV